MESLYNLSTLFFSQVVQQLPPPHFRTLEYLTRHLARVAEHNASTGMTAKNVAIVWAPNLLRCKELEFGGVAALQVYFYYNNSNNIEFRQFSQFRPAEPDI